MVNPLKSYICRDCKARTIRDVKPLLCDNCNGVNIIEWQLL